MSEMTETQLDDLIEASVDALLHQLKNGNAQDSLAAAQFVLTGDFLVENEN